MKSHGKFEVSLLHRWRWSLLDIQVGFGDFYEKVKLLECGMVECEAKKLG